MLVNGLLINIVILLNLMANPQDPVSCYLIRAISHNAPMKINIARIMQWKSFHNTAGAACTLSRVLVQVDVSYSAYHVSCSRQLWTSPHGVRR